MEHYFRVRYTYDLKGMTYVTKSNSVGIPHALILPDCTPNTINKDGSQGCDGTFNKDPQGNPVAFNPADASTLYSYTQKAGQAAVIAGAFKEHRLWLRLLAGRQLVLLTIQIKLDLMLAAANAALIGSDDCNTNFGIIANAQGVGIAPIASSQQLFVIDQDKAWTSTDPKMTIDFKPNDSSLLWYTYATGFKAGGWQLQLL